jgi:hypothetical protein
LYWKLTGAVVGADEPPSSSETTIEIVYEPAGYEWASPLTGEVTDDAIVCADPSPQSTL